MNILPDDVLRTHVFPACPLPDCVSLAACNPRFNQLVKHRIAPLPTLFHIYLLRKGFRTWKHSARMTRGRSRRSSWSRQIHHPDERYIF